MISLSSLLLAACAPLLALGHAYATPTINPAPQPTFCGDIIRKAESVRGKLFNATDAFKCLTSVPFNPAVASRFVKYFNDTLEFHSTLAYLKEPPQGYQQPASDLVHHLGVIQSKIDQAQFHNEYEFEEAVEQVIYSAHDKHLLLNAGILSAFRFYSPFSIVSVSLDGKEKPKLYIRGDARMDHFTRIVNWAPSPILTINGENAEEYLTAFVRKQSPGNLDPHADWNSLMYSPAQIISGDNELFLDSVLYPGDTIQMTFENGSSIGPEPFKAVYINDGPTGPLETGGDFYNFFVLGYYPEGFYEKEILPLLDQDMNASTDALGVEPPPNFLPNISSNSLQEGWSEIDQAWPRANLLQADFDGTTGAMISGYFLNGTDLAVLSIPTFHAQGYAINRFVHAIDGFIKESISQGKTRLIIDLQHNGGGSSTLAVDTFRRFFPDIEPYMATRMRAQEMANEIGTITDRKYREWLYDGEEDKALGILFDFSSSEWVVSNRINPDTNKTFVKWAEFFGPIQAAGDNFTRQQLYNFTDVFYITDSLSYPETSYIVYGYPGNRPENATRGFSPENITIVTDGLCDSACALFVEMMRSDVGVKTVSMGGRPSHGPMQTTGGTRGARQYPFFNLDYDMEIAKNFSTSTHRTIASIPERINDIFTLSAGINTRDFMRRGQNLPLQFIYDAADCRLYYTKETLFNQTALWILAAQAMQAPEKFCVPGSTNKEPPTSEHPPFNLDTTTPLVNPLVEAKLPSEIKELGHVGTQASNRDWEKTQTGKYCSLEKPCPHSLRCIWVRCATPRQICVPTCRENTFCLDSNRKLTGECIGKPNQDVYGSIKEDQEPRFCEVNVNRICDKVSVVKADKRAASSTAFLD